MKYLNAVATDAEVVDPELKKASTYLSRQSNQVTFFKRAESYATFTTTGEVVMYEWLSDGSRTQSTLPNGTSVVKPLENGFSFITNRSATLPGRGVQNLISADLSHYYTYNEENMIGMFNCCYNLTSVVLPSDLKTIACLMFQECYDLANLIIPNSVTKIASRAFKSCTSLSLNIPASVVRVEHQALPSGSQNTYNGSVEAFLNAMGDDWPLESWSSHCTVTCTDGVITYPAYGSKPTIVYF